MGNLERINMFYKMYQQEDALETILNLLNSINDSLRNKAVYKIFAVDVGLKCKCLPYECKS